MRTQINEPERFNILLREHFFREDIPVITGISTDSREVQPGDMFIPIVGQRVDGHEFVYEAIRAGAVALLAMRELTDLPPGILNLVAEDSIRELALLAAAWRRIYTQPLVAVTGSNGKTTTKDMVVAVLSKKYRVMGSDRSYNNFIGLPPTLMQLDGQTEIAVVELGSNHPGEIAELAGISQPDVGLITNISETHVAFLSNREGVAREKGALFQALPRNGTAVVNLDDPLISRLETQARRLTYGFQTEADVIGRYVKGESGDSLLLVKENKKIHLPVTGYHQIQNALAAVTVGILLEVPVEDIKEALENISLRPGRGAVYQRNGITIIDDSYNANLASTLAGLEVFLRRPVAGRRVMVFGDMLELGRYSEEHHRRIGELAAAQEIDELFCYGPESRTAYCTALSVGKHAHHFSDKASLAATLVRTIEPGDTVYVKGSRGMALETVVEELLKG